jgi:hypothetical protein
MAAIERLSHKARVTDSERNRAYYERRAAQERAAAERSDDERVRRSHLELARRYGEAAANAPEPMRPEATTPGLLTPEFRILG